MNKKDLFTKKRLVFILLFILLTLISKQINFSKLLGEENQFFTLFQFISPLPGIFLGPFLGILSVLVAQLIEFLLVKKSFSLINLIRLTPALFAAYYFGTTKKNKESFLIPLIMVFLFVINPIGRDAWIFSLYFFIPLIIRIISFKYTNLFLKSLGATFSAYSVGSVIWIYSFPTTSKFWITLIPIVFYERLIFSLGITGSYILISLVLNYLITKFELKIPKNVLNLNKKLSFKKILNF